MMDEALIQLGMAVPDSALAGRAREQVSHKPTSLAAEMAARGILEEIAQAPFDS